MDIIGGRTCKASQGFKNGGRVQKKPELVRGCMDIIGGSAVTPPGGPESQIEVEYKT